MLALKAHLLEQILSVLSIDRAILLNSHKYRTFFFGNLHIIFRIYLIQRTHLHVHSKMFLFSCLVLRFTNQNRGQSAISKQNHANYFCEIYGLSCLAALLVSRHTDPQTIYKSTLFVNLSFSYKFYFSAKVHSHSRIAKMAEGQDDPKKITITVKTPKEKQQVEIEEDADIKRVSRGP